MIRLADAITARPEPSPRSHAVGRHGAGDREADAELGVARLRLDFDVAVVAANELARDVETEAGALARRLAGDERVEDPVADVRRDPGAVVLDAHDDPGQLPADRDGHAP